MGENISFVIPLKFKVICYISKRLYHISFNKNHKNDSQFLGKSLKYEISSDLKFQGLKIRFKLKFPIYDIYIHSLSFHFRCIWNGSMTASPDISSPTIRSALLKRASQKCIENLSLPLEIGIGKSNQIYYWLVEASEWRSFLSLRKHFFSCRMYVQYVIAFEKQNTKIFTFREPIAKSFVEVYMTKGFPLRDKLNFLLRWEFSLYSY